MLNKTCLESSSYQNQIKLRLVTPSVGLGHISPLAWEHVNLTGDYNWDKLLLQALEALRPIREQKIATRFPGK
jgi:hypothetical protein